ncbi:MAG: FAD-binding oxidoreductase [Phycisphaerae bacterium]|nr:FAD-binding oxidoreductase [Phycisphaerae bacterium]
MTELWVILISAGLVLGISAAFAALLLVAERYLANYGQCVIDVNRGSRRLEVRGGETLLSTLMGRQIFIPSACGGKGTCAYCKVKVLEGAGTVAPTEQPLLTAEDVANNVRISCQVKVRNDMAIEIPGNLLNVKQYTGAVERIRDLTHDIKELRIKLTDPPTIEFVPGQYVQLMAPAYKGSPEAVYRAYSIASPPHDAGYVELIIRRVPGGTCTTWVFEHLAEGDEVSFNGPYGEFRLSGTDAEMVWIAGGSGMAPFWSIVRHMKQAQIARKCTYFFGAVRKGDLFFTDELRQLDRELDWFTFVPALSAPAESDQWDGATGLITEVVGKGVSDAAAKEGYLCGSGGMIDAAVKTLKGKGMPEEKIYYDKFT